MSANIDLTLDSGGGGLVGGGTIPTLTRDDVYTFRLRIQEAPAGLAPRDIDLGGTTLKLGIGGVDDVPTDGQFLLTLSGPVTSSAISYNATTTQFFNAISGIAGNATVTTYGLESNSWLVTAATANTALSFGGDSYTLFPSSSVLISTRRNPTAQVKAQQVIQLVRNPAVFANSFSSASTAGVVSLTKIQDGASNKNETYRLAVGPDAVGGSFALEFGGNSTTALVIGATAVSVQAALAAVTGVGLSNVSVQPLSDSQGYTISFVGALANTNITTALTVDSAGVYFIPWKTATVTMATAELDELFAEEGDQIITQTLEIELTDGGNPKTLLQTSVDIRRDLITSGSAVPAPRDSYYTKAETDSLFVEDSSTNVDATNRKLKASDGSDRLAYGAGIGFFGATAVSQQANINVPSGLINLGLFQSSTTYGVFPLSPRTLTTTASIYFGQVNSNSTNSVSVTVTGCNLNDVVLVGLPANIANGLAFAGHVTTADGIELDCINATNGNITPATATYRFTVIGY